MNWGTGITIAIIGFVGFIIYLVIGVSSVDIDLEYPNYYERELVYENEIIAAKNQQESNYNVTIGANTENIEITFSNIESPQNILGEVHFFRPSDASKDQIFELNGSISSQGLVQFPTTGFAPGKYIVNLSYIVNGEKYLVKQNLFI